LATIQAQGVGSGLDVNSLVTQLVAAERGPRLAQITRKETDATLQISALGSLKGALSAFRTALEGLKTVDAFTPRSALSGDEKIFTASATTAAATGSYDIEVVDLAKAHQLASSPFLAGATTVVGTGALTITQGTTTFIVNIDETNNTLSGIRAAINTATGNPGVQATLINEVGGSRLVLTSSATGSAGALKVTQAGGDGGLAPFAYDPQGTMTMTEMQAAQQAHIRIGIYDHYSSTNSISEAIDGVTLNLKAGSEGETVSLQVTNDNAAVTNRVKAFVAQYNALYNTFAKLRSYNAQTKEAGPMLGDALLQGIEERVRGDLTNPVSGLSGTYTSLASIGVAKQVDGTLKLDETKLNAALTADRTGVAQMLGSANGVASRLYKGVDAALGTNAGIDARNLRLQSAMKDVQLAKEALDKRMAAIETRYRTQFGALDVLLTRMQQTSSYLSQQLANLPGVRSS
jgi:flagellar hook-associated protein 2